MTNNTGIAALLEHYESAITEGILRSGDRLPAERKLAEQFQISRASVREALQQLRGKGWIRTRQGGGHFISTPMEQGLAQPLLSILSHHPDAHFDLLEFRHSIEGDCAYNAALRANELDLAAISGAYERLQAAFNREDVESQAEADAAFHLTIAEASHNLIFLHLIKSLMSVFQSNMVTSISQMLEDNSARKALMNQHAAIYEAVVDRQPSKAKAAAQSHVHFVEELLKNMNRESQRKERSLRRQAQMNNFSPK